MLEGVSPHVGGWAASYDTSIDQYASFHVQP
jgi:Copper binding octapeptide repeat.